MIRKYILPILGLSVFFLIAAFVFVKPHAFAAYCDSGSQGLNGCQGYFTGNTSSGSFGTPSNVLTNGLYVGGDPSNPVNSVSEFENLVQYQLNNGGKDAVGAAFIVDSMLGYGPITSGTGQGINYAQNHFGDWKTAVETVASDPDSGIGVDWSSWPNVSTNSAYFSDIGDDAYHTNSSNPVHVVDFYWNNASTHFYIEISCANLIGGSPALPKWNLDGTSTVSATSARPGQSVTFTHVIKNVGRATAQNWGWAVAGNTGINPSNASASALGQGVARTVASHSFTIPAGAAAGTVYCEHVNYSPPAENVSGTASSAQACVTVTAQQSCANLPPGAPCGDITVSTCDNVTGWAFDPDRARTGASTWIILQIDGVQVANVYLGTDPHGHVDQTINNTYGITGRHGFTFNPTTELGLNRYAAHTVSLLALNYSGITGLPATYGFMDSETIPACEAPPTGNIAANCGAIYGNALDPNSAQVRVRVSVDGGGVVDLYPDSSNDGAWSVSTTNLIGKDFVGHVARATVYGRNGGGGEDGQNIALGPVGFGPCTPAVSCSGISGLSGVEAGAPFSVTAAVSWSPNVSAAGYPTAAGGYYFRITGSSGVTVANQNPGWNSFPSSAVTNPTTATVTGGSHTLTATFGGPGMTDVICNQDFDAGFKPYLSVFGGNVVAGQGNGAGASGFCTTGNANAKIESWNNEAASYSGAGTQFAALALSDITDFATAVGTPTSHPSGLAFANPSAPTSVFGGNFGSAPSCSDYTQGLSNPITADTHIPLTILANGSSQTIYVKGHDVYIDSNVVASGAYATVSDIPSFKVVVEGGNIYINRGVTQLYGTYIAEPSDDTTGNIYTCGTDNSGTKVNFDDQLYAICSPQLTVNGAFVARKVYFWRTPNSLKDSATNQNGLGTSKAAEIFNYGPETWIGGIRSKPADNWNSAAGLPPIL